MNDFSIHGITGSSAGAVPRTAREEARRDTPEGGPSKPLGTNYEIVVQNENLGIIGRYFLQEVAREVIPEHRVGICLRSLKPNKPWVEILYNREHQKAHYKNLMVCGSVWLCAVCASKISERRKNELIQGVNNHDLGLAMVTFTMRHSAGDSLKENLDILQEAILRLVSGGWFQRFKSRWGLIGSVTNLEITYGENGWHPHKHLLYFFDREISSYDLQVMRSELVKRYLYLLDILGGSALDRVACDVVEAKTEKQKIAEYMAKTEKTPWGIEAEMTKSHVKMSPGGGLSFWELLKRASDGEYKYILLVREYAKVTKGKQSLYYSKGLRKKLSLGSPETDLEIAEKIEEHSELLAIVAKDIWARVSALRLRGQLLEVANSGDIEQISAFLGRLFQE